MTMNRIWEKRIAVQVGGHRHRSRLRSLCYCHGGISSFAASSVAVCLAGPDGPQVLLLVGHDAVPEGRPPEGPPQPRRALPRVRAGPDADQGPAAIAV